MSRQVNPLSSPTIFVLTRAFVDMQEYVVQPCEPTMLVGQSYYELDGNNLMISFKVLTLDI